MVLTDNQRKAVEHGSGKLVIAACAGSGKTRVLSERVRYLVKNGTSPESIFVGTFTTAAAAEMAERIKVGDLVDTTFGHLGTLHSFGYRVLRESDDKFSVSRKRGEGSIIMPGECKSLVKYLLQDRNDFNTIGEGIAAEYNLDTERDASRLYAQISKLKNELVTPETYGKRSDADPALLALWTAYESCKRSGIRGPKSRNRHRLYDMDDMLCEAYRILKNNANLLAKYQAQFVHVLVDEAQDCNNAQYVLIGMLANKHGNLTIVGDDDQSIYGFRGARPDEFVTTSKSATLIPLDTNFRSHPEIIQVAANLIANNSDRIVKDIKAP